MKIIFFGLGSIGQRHARILLDRKKDEICAFRSNPGEHNELGIKEVYSWKEVDQIKPEVAFITNPTSMHIETALACAKRGMHLFIEKPIDCTTKGLAHLLTVVRQRKLSAYVAYVLRFHPLIHALRNSVSQNKDFYHMRVITTSNLARWRKGRDPLKTYSAKKSLGGGVILDLSHEIDYVQYILGDIKKITGRSSRRSDLTVDTEDFADMHIETKKGPVNVHIDYLSQYEQRLIQIDFKDSTLVADLITGDLKEFSQGEIKKEKQFEVGYTECFKRQIDFFLKNIDNPKMMNNLFEAAKLYKKIIEFKKKDKNP